MSAARYGQVFGAEGDVVPQPGEDHLRLGVLLHQPGTPALGARRGAVDQQGAGLVGVLGVRGAPVVGAGVAVTEHSGEGMQQRGFACAGGAQEQYAFAGLNVQVEAAGLPAGTGRRAASPSPVP